MRVIGFSGAAHATPDLPEQLQHAGAALVIRSMRDLPAVVHRLDA
jgi:hypothetical protein